MQGRPDESRIVEVLYKRNAVVAEYNRRTEFRDKVSETMLSLVLSLGSSEVEGGEAEVPVDSSAGTVSVVASVAPLVSSSEEQAAKGSNNRTVTRSRARILFFMFIFLSFSKLIAMGAFLVSRCFYCTDNCYKNQWNILRKTCRILLKKGMQPRLHPREYYA